MKATQVFAATVLCLVQSLAAAQEKNLATPLDYLFPNIPSYRTDGPAKRPRFVLKIKAPIMPSRMAAYELEESIVNAKVVDRLAATLNLSADARQLRNGKWEVAERGENPLEFRSLVVYEASGALSFLFDNLLFAASEQPPKLPSEREAHELAVRFLKDKDLLPADAITDIQQVRFARPLLIERSAKEKKNLREVVTGIEVRLPRVLDGYKVRGPGSKLYVALGPGGRVLGLTRIWRPAKRAETTFPTIQPADAVALLEEGVGVLDAYPDCVQAEVAHMEPVYWMEGPRVRQRLSLPVYRLEGTCFSNDGKALGEFQAYAPAVQSVPVALR